MQGGGLPHQWHRSLARNDTLQELQRITGDGVRAARPPEGKKGAAERADVGIGPYGGYGSCASPVRVVREADPYGIITENAAIKAKQAADPWWASRLFFRKRREKHFVREYLTGCGGKCQRVGRRIHNLFTRMGQNSYCIFKKCVVIFSLLKVSMLNFKKGGMRREAL